MMVLCDRSEDVCKDGGVDRVCCLRLVHSRLVCVLFFFFVFLFTNTATTALFTSLFGGRVRCVLGTCVCVCVCMCCEDLGVCVCVSALGSVRACACVRVGMGVCVSVSCVGVCVCVCVCVGVCCLVYAEPFILHLCRCLVCISHTA